MRRKHKPQKKKYKIRKYRKKIYGKGFFRGYANLLDKIIKKTL